MKQTDVASLPAGNAKPLTSVAIKAFFEGKDAEHTSQKVAQIEGSRLQSLFRYFPNTDVSSVKEAVKGYREAVEREHEKEGGKKSSAYKVASNRASDITNLYGAWRFKQLKPEGLGYHDAVARARELLKTGNLRWDGGAIPTKDEKSINKQAETAGRLAMLVEKEKLQYERAHPGEEVTTEKLAEMRQKNADAIRKAGAIDMSRKLYERQGAEFCSWMIDALEACIASGEQEEAKEQEKHQQAA
jgi:hypothetical protein